MEKRRYVKRTAKKKESAKTEREAEVLEQKVFRPRKVIFIDDDTITVRKI